MSIHVRNLFLAAVAAVAIPLGAQTAVVSTTDLVAGQFFTGAEVLVPGNLIEFQFNVLQRLKIDQFSLSGTGNDAGADLSDVRFGFSLPTTVPFTTVTSQGSSAFAGGFLPGSVFAAGDTFSVFLSDGIINPVSLTLSFSTATVPLPAAGLLLGPILLLGGVVARRRSRKA